CVFFFQAEDGIRDGHVTGVQTCALPILRRENEFAVGVVVIAAFGVVVAGALWLSGAHLGRTEAVYTARFRTVGGLSVGDPVVLQIGRASCRERVWVTVVEV